MSHYRSNLRDLEFALFEVFGRGEVLGTGPFAEMDPATARGVLAEVDRLARGPLAASFADHGAQPAFDPATGSVTLPPAVTASIAAIWAGEWHRLDLPDHLGGMGAPPSLRWAAAELLLGANPAAFFYMAGPGFAAIVDRLATPEQQAIARHMVERRWGATMVLTEPDAGSDVGAGRTRAVRQADGSWHLSGVKRFITSGDWDWPENIVHLVLARPEGHGAGTKGLSLFLVPKYRFDLATGEPGERNGVFVTKVEHKLGLTASATCELRFGEREPAVGWLLGEQHDGIAQMFKVIEHARMLVGTKSIATLSTGYLNALEFARTRVQGADLAAGGNRAAPRVTITHHPDVRRMLMLQKSYAEGLRALVLYTATQQDAVALAEAAGGTDEAAARRNDLLLPLVKGVGSERSFELLALALQVLGGSGYLTDYPHEQYLRDAKIDTLYEGTTTIQGMDLFFRKVVRDRGAALTALLGEVAAFAKGDAGNGALAAERDLLGRALEDVQGIVAVMVTALTETAEDPRAVYRAGLNTTRLLLALGDLVVGWLLLREAEVALAALAGGAGRDELFYTGKVAAARFFAGTRLPLIAGERAAAERVDLALMDLDEGAF